MKSAKILICDYHVGCQMSIWHSLNSIGIRADILTKPSQARVLELSIPKQYIKKTYLSPKIYSKLNRFLKLPIPAFEDMKLLPSLYTKSFFAHITKNTYDLAICSFYPKNYLLLKKSGIAKNILLIAGHRIDLWIADAQMRKNYFKTVQNDWDSDTVHFAALNHYDQAYIKYYTGKEAILLECFRNDIIQKTKTIDVDNKSNIPLFAPRLFKSDNGNFIEDFFQNKSSKISPAHIRALYGQYKLSDLCQHQSAVLLPDSVFSILTDELFSMGLRMFVPSNRLLNTDSLHLLGDVKLYPMYASMQQISDFEADNKSDSPNRITAGIDDFWLEQAAWNFRQGTERWDSLDELYELVSQNHFEKVKRNIQFEQERAYRLTKIWRQEIATILR